MTRRRRPNVTNQRPTSETHAGRSGGKGLFWTFAPTLLVLLIIGGGWMVLGRGSNRNEAEKRARVEVDVPDIDLSPMFPSVAEKFRQARSNVLAQPGSAETWGALAILCDANEQIPEALTCYRKAHELAPDDLRWPYLLAYLLELEGGDESEIIRLLMECAAHADAPAVVHFRLANAWSRRGNHAQAEQSYRKAIALNPDSLAFRRALGQFLLPQGRTNEAIESLTHVAAQQPDDAPTHAALATAYRRSGDRAKAGYHAQRAADLEETVFVRDPIRKYVHAQQNEVDAIYAEAKSLLERRQFQQAVPKFKEVADILRDDPIARLRLATAQLFAGNMAGWHESFQEADALSERLKNAPQEYERYQTVLSQVWMASLEPLARTGQTKLLGRALDELSVLVPELGIDLDAHSLLNWGGALVGVGRYESALEKFQQALAQDPALADAHFNMAVCYEYLNQPAEAITHYEKAVALDPRHQAAQRLEELRMSTP